MTQCLRCQVEVAPEHTHCPLCDFPLNEHTTPSPTAFPHYQKERHKHRKTIKVWLFVTFVLSTLAIATNALTWSQFSHVWSPIVAILLFYFWFLARELYRRFYINLVAKTLWYNYLILSTLMIVIDVSNHFLRWSLNYAIPFLGIGTGLLMTLWSIKNKSMWRDDIGYLLLIIGVNSLPLLLFFFKAVTVLWPSVLSILYGTLTAVGIWIFSGKRLMYELQKRFHF
ncbi:DUF6320 domain-containing protein [Vagococcus lutrae]|uniref:DUF6320 domain-containing protein n=1 Tax=Vagococcus lutrae TaxID=81947 RepID=UPI001443C765|nr:DUF6320 domain-containing protein [Vagococcus lutrae]NKZ27941.1 hypothetical protein [Vagococcus lutrae]